MNLKKTLLILILTTGFIFSFLGDMDGQCSCSGPYLSLNLDSFPNNEYQIIGNVIAVLGVCSASSFDFSPNFINVDSTCFSSYTLQQTPSDTSFAFLAGIGGCQPNLNAIKWSLTAICNNGNTITEVLEYEVLIKPIITVFADTLKAILNVDSIMKDSIYEVDDICRVFELDFRFLVETFPEQLGMCNAIVRVSNGRKKKKNFTDDDFLVKSGSDNLCDTFQLEWGIFVSDSCPLVDTTTIYLVTCPPALTIVPDSFPPDLVEFHNDTIVSLDCDVFESFAKLIFDENDVTAPGACQVQTRFSPGSGQGGFFENESCPDELPTVTWYAIVENGSFQVNLDTIDSLSYKIATKLPFLSFNPSLAAKLGVGQVDIDEYYEICDTSIIEAIDENDVSFLLCNASAVISKGRKKRNFKGSELQEKNGSSCDTTQVYWVAMDDPATGNTCQFVDSVSIYLVYCEQKDAMLQIIPDSLPDYVEFRNDTMAINRNCLSNQVDFFNENDVEWIGNCSQSGQIHLGFSDGPSGFPNQDISSYFQSIDCANNDTLPIITWYGVVDNGGVPDTITSLSFRLTDTRLWGFSSEIADLMGVDTVLNGGTYSLCNDSIFQDTVAMRRFVNFTECNTSVRVSTGRKKKKNFKGDMLEKAGAAPCDTFVYSWFPFDFGLSDTCIFYESNIHEIFVEIDDIAPEFTFTPPDITIPSGTPPLFGIPIAEDNCTTPSLSFLDEMQTNGTDTTHTRTWTADDGCQAVTTSQSITVRPTAINLWCSDNIITTAQPGVTEAIVNWSLPQATSDCSMGSTDCEPENIPGFNFIGEMNGMAYYISTKSEKWTDAKAISEANGGQLAIVDSPEKNSFLAGGIGFFNAAFIGLNDVGAEGIFEWIDGTPFSYQNWRPNSPDGGTVENYVAMHGWSNGLWGDYNFWVSKKYIMEKSCTGSSGLNIEQVAGLPNSSMFPIGETVIIYEATDACGNSSTCSFSVIVEPNSNGDCDKNVALNKPVSQSSVNQGGVPERAVDGNTNGIFYQDHSVALTEWEHHPWWEVDIVKPKFIDQINLWNRTDCCEKHTAGLYVLVSDDPFVSDDLDEILGQPGVSPFYIENEIGRPSTVSIKREGRYVRVQMNKESFMSLAEVEVLGCDSTNFNGSPSLNSLFFDANLRQGDKVLLRWAEQHSDSTDYFILEKSTDNVHFETLFDRIAPNATGHNNFFKMYDTQLKEGDNFYRLKVVHKNGTTAYAPIRKVAYDRNGDFFFFPNPANSYVHLYLERFTGRDIRVSMTNAYGQPVFEQSFQDIQQDMVKIDLGQNGVREGVYFVSVIHKGRALAKRLVVARD